MPTSGKFSDGTFDPSLVSIASSSFSDKLVSKGSLFPATVTLGIPGSELIGPFCASRVGVVLPDDPISEIPSTSPTSAAFEPVDW